MRVLLRALRALPLRVLSISGQLPKVRVTLDPATLTVTRNMTVDRPCPWLMCIRGRLPPLTLNLSYVLWSGTTPVLKILPLEAWLRRWLKQMFGECMSREMTICLALLTTKALRGARSGKLFTNMARDPTLLALLPLNLVPMHSGVEQAQLPLPYLRMARCGLLKHGLEKARDTARVKPLTGETLPKILLRLEARVMAPALPVLLLLICPP